MRFAATAYHEAGHAVAAWRLGIGVRGLSIESDSASAGRMLFRSSIPWERLEYDNSDRTRMRVERELIVTLAGIAAQRRHAPRSVRAWHSEADRRHASTLALWANGDGETATAYLRWLSLRTDRLIAGNWQWVEAVARLLAAQRTIKGNPARAVFRAAMQERISSLTTTQS